MQTLDRREPRLAGNLHGVGRVDLGELPIDGPAPAVVNALRHTGLDVRAIPATPERLSRAPRRTPEETSR